MVWAKSSVGCNHPKDVTLVTLNIKSVAVTLRSIDAEVELAARVYHDWKAKNPGKSWQKAATVFVDLVCEDVIKQAHSCVLYVVNEEQALLCSGDARLLFIVTRTITGWKAKHLCITGAQELLPILIEQPAKILEAAVFARLF